MISLFLKGTLDFNNNGKVLNEWIVDSLKITEDIEGIFDLEGDYPIKDTKNFSQYLVRGNIIRSPIYDNRPEQLFRIRKTSLDSSGSKISVYAQAIARCDLMNDFVFGGGSSPLVTSGKNRKEAIGLILGAVQDNVGKFHAGTLDANTNTSINLGLDDNGNVINYIDVSYCSPLSGILDNSDNSKSIYNAYGGEIIFNNFEVNMVDERGKDNSFIIKSGKNLQEFQQDIDDTSDDFATVLIMKSADGIYLPNNEVISSPNVNILGKRYKVITCEDVSAVDETPAALNIVYAQLRERGQKKFTDDGIDALTISNTVKFAQLKKTEQYKDYNILEKCELGNNVTIIYSKLNNLTATARVTKIVYSPLALNGQGKILEVTIGNRKKANIANIINNTTNTANNANTKSNQNTSDIKKVKKNTDEFKVTMEARADSIELSVENETQDRIAAINILDGEIDSKVDEGDFGTLITQNSTSVVTAIHGKSDNKVTIDSSGLTVTSGGFQFEDSLGNIILQAITSGGIRVGKNTTTAWENDVMIGGYFLSQLIATSKLMIDANINMSDAGDHDIDFSDCGDTYGILFDSGNIRGLYHGYGIGMTTSLYTNSHFYADGDIDCSGDKACLQETKNYGKRRISAYETAEYYFGDIYEGTINSDGECLIYIDDVFAECVNTDISYHVFIQAYNGKINSIDRQKEYFIVYGETGTEFSAEIKAKRINRENHRLEMQPKITEDDYGKKIKFDDELINSQKDINVIGDLLNIEQNTELENILLEG